MYWHHTPLLIQALLPSLLWRKTATKREIFLTFDDGPVPEATPWVLEQLNTFQAKATFFMVGDNVAKYPQVFKQVCNEGHTVANHSFNHLKGWSTQDEAYLSNIAQAEELIAEQSKKLFRPPYGQIKLSQMRKLRKEMKIVMWDVLSGDFDQKISASKCLENTIKPTRSGSIVVFHDSIKSMRVLQEVLPAYLQYFSEKGYKFRAL